VLWERAPGQHWKPSREERLRLEEGEGTSEEAEQEEQVPLVREVQMQAMEVQGLEVGRGQRGQEVMQTLVPLTAAGRWARGAQAPLVGVER
jgi:hypothetical protein